MTSLTAQRETARVALLEKIGKRVVPPPPVRDATLQADTEQLYQELTTRLGLLELGRWLVMEFPWLDKSHIDPLHRWWILQRKYDEVMGIEHKGLMIVYPPELLQRQAAALRTPAPETA